ncbi:DUF4396 domain-containing protein [Candidatus Nanopelagicales bacterium]|nr:DUF4396 domain-containing protein [Candidatus Nanopelagicales bacterium]
MLDGVMLLWWILTIPSFLFVLIDIFVTTPEATVMKWAFVILTAFTGPIGAFFYVLGCREPIKGTHEQYVSVRWRQVLGSTMHCAAGDGIGIIFGAAIGAALTLTFWPDFLLEYVLGFSFGWAYFQAFAMKDMAGGDYKKSLKMTFLPEFLSMNCLMSGMLLVSKFWMPQVAGGNDPSQPQFWFIMSMSLIGGFAAAYPMNWWMVSNHMKHGMITVLATAREEPVSVATGGGMSAAAMAEMSRPPQSTPQVEPQAAPMQMPGASRALKARMIVVSVSVLAVTLAVIVNFA